MVKSLRSLTIFVPCVFEERITVNRNVAHVAKSASSAGLKIEVEKQAFFLAHAEIAFENLIPDP